jgi:serine phosphatase RsbU (regulator of sigma subunit)
MHAPSELNQKEYLKWLLQQCWDIRLGNPTLSIQYAEEALGLSQQLNDKVSLGRSLSYLAFFTFAQNEIGKAIPMIDQALDYFDEEKNEYEKSIAYVLRGACHLQIGDYDRGFEDMLKGLELGRKYNHEQAISVGEYMLGNYYLDSRDFELAYNHYEISYKFFEAMQDKSGMATVVAGLGNIATETEQYEVALEYHQKSLEISREISNPQVEARNLHDLGVVFEKLEQYETAIEYLNQSLAIRKEKRITQGIISCYTSLGRVYMALNWFDLAIEKLQEAITMAQEVGSLPKLVKAYKVLADVYKKKGQAWEALDALEKYIELKNVVAGDESNAKLKAIQALHEAEDERQEAEIHRLKNIELKEAYQKIESQNQHIIESIKYARRIQEALLPPESEMSKYDDMAFIFYRPKDIVSGDFYWYAHVGEQMILACVDCTGHGVPGAFMVVMGISLLDEIVNEQGITEPTEILTRLDQKIRQALKQDQTDTRNTQDGMDLSIVRFCGAMNKISFSGARSSLFYVRNNEINEVKGSMYPIGSSQYVGEKSYPQFEIDILPTDVFYMATDGFRDQFGGEENKKYTKPRFREFLRSISHLPMPAQDEALAKEFDSWKRHYAQTDDVLVMGFKKH